LKGETRKEIVGGKRGRRELHEEVTVQTLHSSSRKGSEQ